MPRPPGTATMRLTRAGLLATTALCLHAGPAAAQLAPNARPQGGQVVAGSASIATAPTTTTINQSSQRAAINWTSFDVGSKQAVVFQQPSATAMTLNTVTGPNPSAIAGRITANGGIVITNQSGVVFSAGAQVDATSLVVSAPGITTQNFMAGHMVFDQAAKPGAAVVNQGTLTIKQAGLAALVAPQVRNSGAINAKLGHVVLAGAAATTLDLYGDGLVSIDITKQVTTAPGGQTALVTNTGLINAAGGTVQLTAAAADGVVTNLVDARGRISTATIGQHTGTIAISGTGGALLIEGSLQANGAQGGAIEVAGPGAVVVGAQAHIAANGRQGGGTVALGTTLARARGGASVTPTVVAKSVSVAAGAKISANATQTGNGGTVTLLSTASTDLEGSITATGGSVSGNGGKVEVSSETNVTLNGMVDVTAAHGDLGTILLDPGSLTITSGEGSQDSTIASTGTLAGNQPDTTTFETVSNTAIEALRGNVVLQATGTVTVNAPITLTVAGQSLTIQAGADLNVYAAINTQGNVVLAANAAVAGAPTPSGTGTLNIGNGDLAGPVTTTGGSVTLSGAAVSIVSPVSASGGISIAASGAPGSASPSGVNTYSTGVLSAGGNIAITSADYIDTGAAVTSSAGNVSLSAPTSIEIFDPITAGPGYQISAASPDITVAAALTVPGSLTAPRAGGPVNVLLQADSLSFNQDGEGGVGSVTAPGGIVAIEPYTQNTAVVVANATVNTEQTEVTQAVATQTLTPLVVTPAELAVISTIGTVAGSPVSGALYLGGVGGPTVTPAISITINTPLDITGIAGTLGLFALGAVTEPSSTITAGTLLGVASTVTLTNANQIGTLGAFTSASGFALTSAQTLTVTGPVTGTSPLITLTAPSLVITGTVATPGVDLTATAGTITQSGNGVVVANTLSGRAQSANFSGNNSVSALGAFTTTNGLTLNDVIPLTVTGPVQDNVRVSLNVQGSITLSGDLTAPLVTLNATGGAITETAGTLTAGTLTGSAGTGAQFGTGTPDPAAITTLGSFTLSSGTFTLVDTVPLTLQGTFVAPYFQIDAPGQITLAGGTIQTAGIPLAQQSGLAAGTPGSDFAVSAVGTGSGSALFSQTGVTTITYLPETQTQVFTRPTVRISVAGNGGISLNDLYAPAADIVLASPAGALTGTLAVNNLLILGYTGSANLSGSVLGRGGQSAAAAAQIGQVNQNYLLNGCVIAAANCGNITITTNNNNNNSNNSINNNNSSNNNNENNNKSAANTPTAPTPTATLLLPDPSVVDLSEALSNAVPQLAAKAAGTTQTLLFGLVFPPTVPGDPNPEIVLPNVSGRDY